MFRNLRALINGPLVARDGEEQRVRNFLFDDQSWSIRFVVIEVGTWASRRLSVIPTAVVSEPDWEKKAVTAYLAKEQLLKSPDADSVKPVSRQQQLALNKHFGWTDHVSDWAIPSALVPTQREFPALTPDDPHLRGVLDITGYEVWTTDGYLGLLEDFVLEQASWHINYLLVDCGDWVRRREQFISTLWVRAISWANHRVTLDRSPTLT
jgi:hypothetical protein